MPTVERRKDPVAVAPTHRHVRVWTNQRKLMGNLIPGLLSLPPAALGLWWMYSRERIWGPGLLIFAVSPLLAWVLVNYLGLFGNESMKTALHKRLHAAKPRLADVHYFVGIATPKHASFLDPHEDIGYIVLHQDALEFFGDYLNLSIAKSQIVSVTFRPNIHSVIGLGRWVSVEGKMDERPIRLNVELREKPSLLGNLLLSKGLRDRIRSWMQEEPRAEARSS